MIKKIKHNNTGMVIKVSKTEEIKENGLSLYRIDGFIESSYDLKIATSLLIPELSMSDFEITYKDFDKL